jgi:hypothetical protein
MTYRVFASAILAIVIACVTPFGTPVKLDAIIPANTVPDDFKVKDCDSDAKADIEAAHRFVAQRLSGVFDPMTFLSSKQRDEMKRKWPKLTADCIDDRSKCFNNPGLGGMAHGGPGNQVNVCYYNLVDLSKTLCDLVEVMVHEEGHANGIPRLRGHNNPTPTLKAQDLVYRMGTSAGNFCRAEATAGRFTDSSLRGKAQLLMGATCSKDDQCTTGRCQQGVCVCKKDSDCASGLKCKKPLIGINKCSK